MITDEKYKLSSYKDISLLLEDKTKQIYLVKDEVTDRLYVKKVFHNIESFDFYKRLAELRHKNLTAIHEVIKNDNEIYIIEDYVNGQTLKALLERNGKMPESEAVGYILQVCEALIYLHSQNPPIIHRDIKPGNIICSTDDIVKLVDFDIAREFKETSNRDTAFMGTKEYAAPEQYGYRQTDCRADIFSVGILIHELITGRLPENNIMYQGTLRKIIDKCLQLDPEKRYQNVSYLKKALKTKYYAYKKNISTLAVIFYIYLGYLSDYIKAYIFDIGGEYEGELADGVENGYGIYTWANGNKYEGKWKNGEMDGHGTYTWPDGSVYEGEWKNGKKEGKGTETWLNGTKYDGEWKNDVPDGYGTYIYENGEKYEGEWENNKMSGYGTYTWADKSMWAGDWKNDLPHGNGIYTDENGGIWHEVYKNGKMVSSKKQNI